MTKLMCISAKRLTPSVAVIADRKLLSIESQEESANRSSGNIYWGTVSSIQTGIDAVFVDFGSQRHGFLPFKEILPQYHQCEKTDETPIGDLIKIGQRILIQVTREEKHNKGAALTTYLSLAGAYLVVMPNNQKKNGISKKADANERAKTKEILSQLSIPEGLSIIVRTEGLNRSKEELEWDLECLLHHWNNIHKATEGLSAPALVHQEGDALIRSVRDRLRKNIDEIVVDDQQTFELLKTYLQQTRPEFEDKITLYQNKVPIFSHYGIQGQIQTLFMRKIELKSGGSIVIDYTEAMTVIDVNSAKSTGAKSIEDTAFQTNKEALEEVIRQITLRDIGGIIVVDFIDMIEADNRLKIEEQIAHIIQREKSKIRFESLSALTGCMMISRQRTGPSIVDQHYEECSHCNGLGYSRSIQSIATTILNRIEEVSIGESGKTVGVQASNDVACYLLNEKRDEIERIEQEHGNKVVITPVDSFITTRYIVKRISVRSNIRSYEQAPIEEPTGNELPKWGKTINHSQPVVPQQIYREHPNVKGGVIQRFMEKLLYSPKQENVKAVVMPAQDKQQKPKSNQRSQSEHGEKRPQRRKSRTNSHMRRGNRKRNHEQKEPRENRKPASKPDRLDD